MERLDKTPRKRSPEERLVGQTGTQDQRALRRILATSLMQFGDDRWTIGDAVEGVQIFGSTGSGKTSGSGAQIARALIRPRDSGGFGGLVLTVKGDELSWWERELTAVGREADLLVLDTSHKAEFNFIGYERRSQPDAGFAQNMANLLVTALSSGGGDGQATGIDPYWGEALRELLVHTVDLILLASKAGGEESELSLERMVDVVRSAPQSRQEAVSASWRSSSLCANLLANSEALHMHDTQAGATSSRQLDLRQTQAYWLRDFPGLSRRTRSIVVSSFTAKMAGLLRSPVRELMCSSSGSTESIERFAPERTFEGRIIVLQLPVHAFDEVGRLAQVLYKTIWQRAVWRRKLTGNWRPVFLWADESQHFVTKDDATYQQTARAKVAATVYLTQNLPNYRMALSGKGESESVHSLLGNLQTKIFHANSDPDTNEWAQRLFGQRDIDEVISAPGGHSVSTRVRRAVEPVLPAVAFTKLSMGGERNESVVEGFVYQTGRRLLMEANRVTPVGFSQGELE